MKMVIKRVNVKGWSLSVKSYLYRANVMKYAILFYQCDFYAIEKLMKLDSAGKNILFFLDFSVFDF